MGGFMKNEDIQVGRTYTLVLDPESSAANEFGEEMLGKIIDRDVIDADKGMMNEMYQTQNKLPVIVIEDEAGIKWNIPERDVLKIVCGENELCD
jgi:hypothetical protein